MGKEVIENTSDQTGHPQQDHLDSAELPLPQSQSLGSVQGKLDAAGNELVNALDNAFAEFEDEDFTLDDDDDDDDDNGEHDHCQQANDADCNITNADDTIPRHLQHTHSETEPNGAQESNDEIHAHVNTDGNDNEKGNDIDYHSDSDTDTECTSNVNAYNNAKTNANTKSNDKMMPSPNVASPVSPSPSPSPLPTAAPASVP